MRTQRLIVLAVFLLFLCFACEKGQAAEAATKIAVVPLCLANLGDQRNDVTISEAERLTKELGKDYEATPQKKIEECFKKATLNYRDTAWEKRKEIMAALPGHDFFIFLGPFPADKEGWFNCVGVRKSDMRTRVVRALVGGEVKPGKPIFEPGDIEKFLMKPLKEEKPEKKKEGK